MSNYTIKYYGTSTTGFIELSPAYAKLSEARLAAATRQSTLDL